MIDYFTLIVLIFIINIVPAFMPPTWIMLAVAKNDNPSLDPLVLVFAGAIASTAGRAVLSFYCSFFRRFFSKDLARHAEEIRSFFEKKRKELFVGTFVYSLSPFPSNLVFIADGLTKVDSAPVFAGFFLGRLVSYYLLVELSVHVSHLFGSSIMGVPINFIIDFIGILAAVSVLFVDWGKLIRKKSSS